MLIANNDKDASCRTDPRAEWRIEAACRGVGAGIFFPVGFGESAMEQAAAAKAICATCPVRLTCLEEAMRCHLDYGIFGGVAEEDRRDMRRRLVARARRRAGGIVTLFPTAQN